jgi:hypothetical protein
MHEIHLGSLIYHPLQGLIPVEDSVAGEEPLTVEWNSSLVVIQLSILLSEQNASGIRSTAF